MATYYEILGLDDHPSDMKSAKRAYAKKLRVTRPDDDPEGFMKLRDALDAAKNEIAWREHDAAQIDEPAIAPAEDSVTLNAQEDEPSAVNISPEAINDLLAETPAEPEPVIEDIEPTGDQVLMSRFSKAFNDPFMKNDKAHWSKLLDEKIDLTIDEHIDFEERFRGALINAYNQWIEDKKEQPTLRRPLPHPIENLIFDKMEWRFLQETDTYKANEVDWLKGQFDLYNREAPKTHQATRVQAPQFEDDGISAPKMIWRIVRTILIIVALNYLFHLF
ncbi:MAG: hypothetical protein ABJ275_08635 [Maricaulaceae bacterium]